jgi:hypothetical protein
MHGGPNDERVVGLETDRIGSARLRHLLLITAFSAVANLKKALNAQEFRTFSQVRVTRHRAVASS